MNDKTVRDPEKRCQSSDVEKPGHTHWCRLGRGHIQEKCICICSRAWKAVNR